MRTYLFTLLVVLLSQVSFGQKYSIKKFNEIAFPTSGSKELNELNWCRYEFTVKIIDGKLIISKAVAPSKVKYDVPSGILIPEDHGEWGGGLYYQPKDTSREVIFVNGKPDTASKNLLKSKVIYYGTPLNKLVKNTHLIQGGNVNSIFELGNEFYYMEGLAHLSYNAGAISKIKIKGDSVTTDRILEFKDAPEVNLVYNDKLYVATYSNFYVVKNWKKEEVFKDIWPGLYPNSIAVMSETEIYVGMRGGFAKLDPIKQQATFYKYNK